MICILREKEKNAYINSRYNHNVKDKDSLPSQIHPWNITRIKDAYGNKISHLRVFE